MQAVAGDPAEFRDRLRKAVEQFAEIQPEISTHTNFEMAAQSLNAAAREVEEILQQQKRG